MFGCSDNEKWKLETDGHMAYSVELRRAVIMKLADRILQYVLHYNFIVLTLWVIAIVVFRAMKLTELSRLCTVLFVLNLFVAFFYVFFYTLAAQISKSRKALRDRDEQLRREQPVK